MEELDWRARGRMGRRGRGRTEDAWHEGVHYSMEAGAGRETLMT